MVFKKNNMINILLLKGVHLNVSFIFLFPFQTKVIVTKFLSAGNSLGASELNSIGGPNLCALDLSVLQGIRNDSLR